MKHLKNFENKQILDSTDEYIELTAKKDYVIFDGKDGFYHVKKSIPKGQTIFLSNYYRHQFGGYAANYPYIVANELPDDEKWVDNPTQGWISRESILKYFE